MQKRFSWFRLHLFEFSRFFFLYFQKKIITLSLFFEKNKNILVKFFTMKRGRYNRPFLHLIAMLVLLIAVLLAPFLADTFPIFSDNDQEKNLNLLSSAFEGESISIEDNVFKTEVSQKPRDEIITYTVQKGETLSIIADKFGISQDTIRWANNLTSDYIGVGDELKILPVTGIAHKVSKGESVYTIAQKYSTNPQQIVDFPFNDFANPETFSLVEGQMLIVPDGVKPTEKPTYKRQTYLVQGPVSFSVSGFAWPAQGALTQYFSWYHHAIDIAAPVGTPVIASKTGRVAAINLGVWDGGYGNNILIDHGGGVQTHYSHLSTVNVSVGDDVVGGKSVIGGMGSTGRSTGSHLDFEVRIGGVNVNPLQYLQ